MKFHEKKRLFRIYIFRKDLINLINGKKYLQQILHRYSLMNFDVAAVHKQILPEVEIIMSILNLRIEYGINLSVNKVYVALINI